MQRARSRGIRYSTSRARASPQARAYSVADCAPAVAPMPAFALQLLSVLSALLVRHQAPRERWACVESAGGRPSPTCTRHRLSEQHRPPPLCRWHVADAACQSPSGGIWPVLHAGRRDSNCLATRRQRQGRWPRDVNGAGQGRAGRNGAGGRRRHPPLGPSSGNPRLTAGCSRDGAAGE